MKLLTSLFLSILSLFLFGQTYEAKSYVVNEEEHHSISKFLPLSNGDYLLNIHRYCNTGGPGIFIEGCPRGNNLIRINSVGDTLWSQPVTFSSRNIFENEDESFSVFHSLGVSSCGQIFSTTPFPIITKTKLNSFGEVIEETNLSLCGENLSTVLQLDNGEFMIFYNSWGFNGISARGGYFKRISPEGEILDFQFKGVEDYWFGEMAVLDNGEIIRIVHVDFKLNIFTLNQGLEVLSDVVIDDVIIGTLLSLKKDDSGKLVLFAKHGDVYKFIGISETGEFLWAQNFVPPSFLDRPRDFTFDENGDFWVATSIDLLGDSDARLMKFNGETGEFISSFFIPIDFNQQAEKIIFNQNNEPIIAGTGQLSVEAGIDYPSREPLVFFPIEFDGFSNFNIEMTVFPNPFEEDVTLKYSLPKSGDVSIQLLNSSGYRIQTIQENEHQEEGWHQIRFQNFPEGNGLYFVQLTLDGLIVLEKMMRLK